RCRAHRIESRPCGSSHPKCARTIATELLEAIAPQIEPHPSRPAAEGLDAAADFHRVEVGHRKDDGEAGRQLQWLRRPTPMSLARDGTTRGGATLASRPLGLPRGARIAAALGPG